MSSAHPAPERAGSLIGLDVGGTKTACVEGTADGQILQRIELSTQASRPFDQTAPALFAAVEQLRTRAAAAGRECVALSVSIGGPLRIDEGSLVSDTFEVGFVKRLSFIGFHEIFQC